jgi:PKD repeat protein
LLFDNPVTYNVTLTASNEIGDTELVKEAYIKVNELEVLTGGGVLEGGNMEDVSKWGTTFLNTNEGSEPSVSWNNTEKVPTAGQGGALYVTGLSNNNTVQYCIYQAVTLDADSIYEFNAAVRDFTANLNQSWLEVYIGPQPIDGLDYSKDDPKNFLLSEFSSWSNECNPKGIDGTFLIHACNNRKFIPPADGEYYFVLKLGSTSWAGDDMPFELAVDELSLTASRVAPVVEFEADKPVGFAPLTVQFTDKSSFGNSWA